MTAERPRLSNEDDHCAPVTSSMFFGICLFLFWIEITSLSSCWLPSVIGFSQGFVSFEMCQPDSELIKLHFSAASTWFVVGRLEVRP